MIKRIEKIVTLMIAAATISTCVSYANPGQAANASVSNSINDKNIINELSYNSGSTVQDVYYNTTALSRISNDQLNQMNYLIKANIKNILRVPDSAEVTLSSSPVGTLSYDLDDSLITNIIGILGQNESLAQMLQGMGASDIKELFKKIPVYQYSAEISGNVIAQGFTTGGPVGVITTNSGIISETYNAATKNAEYSSTNIVPALSLQSGSSFKNKLDLSSSNMKVICDGLHINVLDTKNKVLYAINNPVYNMLIALEDQSQVNTKLTVISFPSDVSDLKAGTSSLSISSKGITTNVLSLSLKDSNSKTKAYKYATTVNEFESEMLQSQLGSMSLPNDIKETVGKVIKKDSFLMIPDVKGTVSSVIGSVSDKVEDVTDTVEDLADAIDDLADSIKDKADDIDEAWDKVFDRFDNEEGWGKRDGYTYYYDEDGIALKGVQKIDGKTYYFNRIDGAMETGWQIVDGKRCYFDKNKGYQLFLQWVQDGDDWYFLSDQGPVKKSEWVNDNGKYYYLKSDGKMTKNWLKIDDDWYYFNETTGVKETSKWKYSSDKWYYLTEDGKAANDWTYINNNWYYFRENSCAMETGWFRADGSWYYADSSGAMKTGWVYGDGGWYYLDDTTGKMKKNDWVYVDGSWYYFNINGNMVTKPRYIDGVKYNFNSDGRMS